MVVESRFGETEKPPILPICDSAIQDTIDQVRLNPIATVKEDLKDIRLLQPILNQLFEKNPYNDPNLNSDFYKYGISRAYRFFRNQAINTGIELPKISHDDLNVLAMSLEEDKRLKKFPKYIRLTHYKIGNELRDKQNDLWIALQNMSISEKEYISYMRGVLTVFFLFKTHQEIEDLEAKYQLS